MSAIHGRRVAASLTLLGVLVLINTLAPQLFPLVVALALIVSPVVCGAAAYYFTQLSLTDAMEAARDGREPIRSLRDRAQTSLLLAIASSAGALLGWLVVFRAFGWIPPVPRETFLVGLSYALLLIAGPAGNWLAVWRPWKRGP